MKIRVYVQVYDRDDYDHDYGHVYDLHVIAHVHENTLDVLHVQHQNAILSLYTDYSQARRKK